VADKQKRTSDALFDLNGKVRELLRTLHRNRDSDRLDELPAEVRAALVSYHGSVDLFLWKVCAHETDRADLAAAAIVETHAALFALAREATQSWWLRRWCARQTIDKLPPNAWLFRQVRQRLRRLQADLGSLALTIDHQRLRVAEGLLPKPSTVQKQLAASHCAFRTNRRRRRDPAGNLAFAGNVRPEECCLRACDLLLLVRLGFRLWEMCRLLDMRKATVHDRIAACQEAEVDLRGRLTPNPQRTAGKTLPPK
jgi:hypothetical protein